MPDWIDADSLITPSRGPYRFTILPAFWTYLTMKAADQSIASTRFVLGELETASDQLAAWALEVSETLFRDPSQEVQDTYRRVVDSVQATPRLAPQHIRKFLAGADPWLIAHAATDGGRIVTFEKAEPRSKKPKIPDVAQIFGVECINMYDLLTDLNATF